MLRQNLWYKVLALAVAIFLWFFVLISQRSAVETQALTVPVVLRTEGEPAPGYRIVRASVRPELVTIAGRAERLRQVTAVETDPVNLAGAQANIHRRAVPLRLPQGIISVSASQVQVDVAIRPE